MAKAGWEGWQGLRDRYNRLYKPGDQGPTALRKVVGYARMLHSLGYVEDAAPARDKGKDKK
jgi:hypothetical protein